MQLSELLADPDYDVKTLNALHSKISKIMGVSIKDADLKISNCADTTIKLLHSYGAGVLTKFINHSSKNKDNQTDPEKPISSEALQLQIIRE